MNNDTTVDRIEVRPGFSVPRVILGCWQLSEGHSRASLDKGRLFSSFDRAIDCGMNAFDCADIYTGVEELLGEYIAAYRRRHGSEAANKIQIHTKLVPDLDQLATIREVDVQHIVHRSRKRLHLERLDLVQFAWWDYDVPRYVEVASWLRDLQADGIIRHIGATNFDTQRLAELLDANIPVAVHQVQYSMIDRRPSCSMADLCETRNVWMVCYGTLGGGILTERYLGADRPVEPFENRSLRKYMLIVEEFGGWDLFQRLLSVLDTIAKRHSSNIAHVAVRYVLEKPRVAAAILGVRSESRVETVPAAHAFSLTDRDWNEIDAMLQTARGPKGEVFGLERDRNGPHGRIMQYRNNAQRPTSNAQLPSQRSSRR